jgi:hypothetical protein
VIERRVVTRDNNALIAVAWTPLLQRQDLTELLRDDLGFPVGKQLKMVRWNSTNTFFIRHLDDAGVVQLVAVLCESVPAQESADTFTSTSGRKGHIPGIGDAPLRGVPQHAEVLDAVRQSWISKSMLTGSPINVSFGDILFCHPIFGATTIEREGIKSAST